MSSKPEGGAPEAGAGGSAGVEQCGGADLSSDPKNCGTCGNICASSPNLVPNAKGISCKDGACFIPDDACISGKKHCSDTASDVCEADVTTNAQCGTCGSKCDSAQVCAEGKCADDCTGGATKCGSGQSAGCYQLVSNADHCGACETACPAPPSNGAAVCQTSACKVQCSNGYHQCNASPECEANDDINHCGPTCKQCETSDPNATPTCANNSCAYPCNSGYQFCGFCISKNDPNNCGPCGNVCGSSKTCVNGACLLNDGATCFGNSDCATGSCNTFYVDLDGDKHGAISSGVKQACGVLAPAGYSAKSDDCCDVGADAAKIFPGQTDFFSAQTTSCNRGWDYDCDGKNNQEITMFYDQSCHAVNGMCLVQESTGMWTSGTTPPACGVSAQALVRLGMNLDTPSGVICGATNPYTQAQRCH